VNSQNGAEVGTGVSVGGQGGDAKDRGQGEEATATAPEEGDRRPPTGGEQGHAKSGGLPAATR